MASKSVTFLVGNAHFPFFTHKIFIPVQVKRGALNAGLLLLWVWPARRALFCRHISSFFIFFTKSFKTYHFGKSIALSGKHGFAFSSRTCRQKLHFCVSTVNECVFIILLLASVRLHILHCSGSSRASFERLSFQKLVQIIQQNLSFCQSRSEKPLLLKSRILKIRQGFSSIFEDRKRLFGSVFDSKLTSPR